MLFQTAGLTLDHRATPEILEYFSKCLVIQHGSDRGRTFIKGKILERE